MTIGKHELDLLREQALKLIAKYNSYAHHRPVRPIEKFGEKSGPTRLYMAYWSNDHRSSLPMGVAVEPNAFYSVQDITRRFTSTEDAIRDFERQLKDIPKGY